MPRKPSPEQTPQVTSPDCYEFGPKGKATREESAINARKAELGRRGKGLKGRGIEELMPAVLTVPDPQIPHSPARHSLAQHAAVESAERLIPPIN